MMDGDTLFDLTQFDSGPSAATVAAYESHKEQARARQAAKSQSGRDIGELPPVADPGRRARCSRDLRAFMESYFPEKFYLGWSEDHLKVIGRIQESAMGGGLFAMAMPRGSGKTTISECAALWATLYGHRRFVVVIGATDGAARQIIEEIKTEIEGNDRLCEDFPEVCVPVRALDGISNRAPGQLCRGVRTCISWTDSEVRFPTVEGSIASGHCIRVAGITGRIRGLKVTMPGGGSSRPDYVLLDDPQTDESAASPMQTRNRVRIVAGAVLGLAGPGVKIAGTMPCTVIRQGDMADQMLDKDQHPEWQGERMRMVRTFPTDMDLWNRYHEIWADSLREHGDIRDATAFYVAHRAAMDAGASVAWPDRYEPGEVSGIQNAMNLFLKDKESFFAEYQNEPLPDEFGGDDKLTVESIWSRMDGTSRYVVPEWADRVTAFADVQKNLLYYVVMAFGADFRAHVVDFGTWPDQKRRYFALRDASPTYSDLLPGASLEQAAKQAVEDTAALVFGRAWRKADGTEVPVELMMVDSGWGKTTDAVYKGCRASAFSSALRPSKGVGITAAQKPMTEYRRQPGDRIGLNWMLSRAQARTGGNRTVLYDTNFWKSFVRERIVTPVGRRAAFSVYGSDTEQCRMFAEQLSSETCEATSGRGRRVDVWTLLPNRENHWLDGVVGCYVAASISGCALDLDDDETDPAAAAAMRRHLQEGGTAKKNASVPVREVPKIRAVHFGGDF